MFVGEKVTLRAIEREDLPLLKKFNNDLAVELAGGGDPPMVQSLARVEAEFEQNSSQGGRDDGNFGIEVEGKLIGICALFRYDHTSHTCELGIAIGDKDYWGKGYGRDAVRLLLKYAFHFRNFHKVYLNVHAKNQRAVRSYLACGFQEEGRLRQHVWSDGAYDDLLYMGVLREEWQAQNF